MKHTINGILYDFDVLGPKIEYIRRTGDYGMEDASVDDYEWEFWGIVLTDGNEAEMSHVVPEADKIALLAYWKDNYDPSE